ncbi:hypothetical protein FS842_002371 [Serendipita sp. 407]|nr:hypothetical protein FS842_002371 [Serendipita sp. 407]
MVRRSTRLRSVGQRKSRQFGEFRFRICNFGFDEDTGPTISQKEISRKKTEIPNRQKGKEERIGEKETE